MQNERTKREMRIRRAYRERRDLTTRQPINSMKCTRNENRDSSIDKFTSVILYQRISVAGNIHAPYSNVESTALLLIHRKWN
jgi:hypothetical protein